jgi:hypothetical protein
MNVTGIVETLQRDEQINLLRHLVNKLLPAGETVYAQQSNGRAYGTVAEERVDYEVPKPRTFQDYFKLNLPADEIGALLGYTYRREALNLNAVNRQAMVTDAGRVANLIERIQVGLQHVGMSSEMARREFLIAPILLEVIHYTNAKVYVEYSIKASETLQGSLDYLFKTEQHLLVVEAKNGDLQRGFHQLMAELAALDLKKATDALHLYGIVSMGDGWQFGRLDRQTKTIIQDTEFYSVPMNTELLIRIMVGILQGA